MTTRDRSFGRAAGLGACLAIAVFFAPASIARAEDEAPAKRILVLHRDGVGTPARARFDAAFVAAVRETDASVDLHLETIDTEQFDGEQLSHVTGYLAHKYSGRPIDVIVAVGEFALAFARDQRDLFGKPAIVAAVPDAGRVEEWTGDVTGLRGGYSFGTTVGLMRALRPDTRRVFVVYGSRDHVWPSETEFDALRQQFPAVSFEYLRDLPLASLVGRLANAPQGSAVLYVRQTMRDQATDVDALEALVKINAASSAPVFSVFEPYLGNGVVGGSMWRFETDAGRLARLAIRILNGERARDIAVAQITNATMLDWRQLQRWNIEESRVPIGADVLFRRPTLFKTYRGYVVTGLGVFAAQLGLIVGLLVQRSRRRGAEERLLKSETQYRSLVETQSELICRFRPDFHADVRQQRLLPVLAQEPRRADRPKVPGTDTG